MKCVNYQEGQPLVSVGIPTHNNPKGLSRTLRDITNQTYKNIEIIISDNNSNNIQVDDVVHSYIKKDSRIRFFKQTENIGSGRNFKFVLNLAIGDFFLWASDDDGWAPEAIEKYVSVLHSNITFHFVSSNVIVFDELGTRINLIDYTQYGVKNRNKYLIYKRASFNMQFTYWIYGLYRTEFLKKIESDITSEFGWDYMIILREILNDKYGYIPLPLFKYTIHQQPTSIRYVKEELGQNYRYKWKWTHLMIKTWEKIVRYEDLKIFDKFFSLGYLMIQILWAIDNDIFYNSIFLHIQKFMAKLSNYIRG